MQSPHIVSKPWGYETWLAHTDRYAGKLLHARRGHRLSLQDHVFKDESSYVLTKRLRLVRGPSLEGLAETEMRSGAEWRNRSGAIHSLVALEDSVMLEVSTPELDDGVRIDEAYGRAGAPSAPVPHATALSARGHA